MSNSCYFHLWLDAHHPSAPYDRSVIPTEPIGSIPRPAELLQAIASYQAGTLSREALDDAYSLALRDTFHRFEDTGSPVVSDGEQTKPSFATYPLADLTNLAPDGVTIPFADGHERQLPRLIVGPFRYTTHAESYVRVARTYTQRPIKQAVIAASALSLLYPAAEILDYPRERFVADLVDEAAEDIRGALDAGAVTVQMDFTEARLSLKLDPSGGLLHSFVDLNNQVLSRFPTDQLRNIGVHVCPGGDRDSTHSADVDYAGLLPELFRMRAGRFYLQMASEPDKERVLRIVKDLLHPDQQVFIGVIDPLDPRIETAAEVRDRILHAATIIPVSQLGTTDDCGFAPFADDTSTARDTAFAKIRSRVEGTALANLKLGL